jgi:hypothetical protein
VTFVGRLKPPQSALIAPRAAAKQQAGKQLAGLRKSSIEQELSRRTGNNLPTITNITEPLVRTARFD